MYFIVFFISILTLVIHVLMSFYKEHVLSQASLLPMKHAMNVNIVYMYMFLLFALICLEGHNEDLPLANCVPSLNII